jgi:phosphate acetyltransferase
MVFEHKTFVFGDCAVNPNPNAKQLADIALASSVTAKIALSDIRLAFLSYSTGKSGFGVDVDLVNNAISEFKNICPPDVKFDGPIQYDAAVDKRVAKAKMPNSEVAGSANVFIFPNLTAGNICYKAVQNTGNLLAVGPILQGLNKPINDLSRGATTDDIVNTILVTALQSSL